MVLSLFAEVTYAFTNRTADMRLTRSAFRWLEDQINSQFCKLAEWNFRMLTK